MPPPVIKKPPDAGMIGDYIHGICHQEIVKPGIRGMLFKKSYKIAR
jgi:hypothetical protein